eukprot:EG_transcript_2172
MLSYVTSHFCVFLEVFGAFYTYHLINHFRFPVVVYVGVAQCVLALLFWGAGRLRRPRSVPGTDGCPRRRFVIHGVWLLLSRALWCAAVVLLHPLMTVLAEGVEGGVYFLLALALRWRPAQQRPAPRTQAVVVLLYTAALALVVTAADVSHKETAKGEGGEGTPTSSLEGLGLLVAWGVLEALRENYKRRLIHETGSEEAVQASTAAYSLLFVLPALALYSLLNPLPLLQILHGPSELLCIALNVLCFSFAPLYAQLRLGEPALKPGDAPRAPNQSVTLKQKLDTALFFTAFGSANALHYVYHHHPAVFVTPAPGPHHPGPLPGIGRSGGGGAGWSAAGFAAHLSSHVDTAQLCLAFLLMCAGLKLSHWRPRAKSVLPHQGSVSGHGHDFLHDSVRAIKRTHTYEEAVHQVDRVDSLFESIMQASDSRKLFIFLALNLSFMGVEIAVGLLTGSLGLVADAFHMLFDNVSIGIALYAAYLSRLPANRHFTYGYGRYEVLSGFTNGILLICVAVYIFVESVGRLVDPPEIGTENLLSVSVGGFLINLVGVVFFHEHHHHPGGACSHGHGHGHAHGHGGRDGACGHSHGPAPPPVLLSQALPNNALTCDHDHSDPHPGPPGPVDLPHSNGHCHHGILQPPGGVVGSDSHGCSAASPALAAGHDHDHGCGHGHGCGDGHGHGHGQPPGHGCHAHSHSAPGHCDDGHGHHPGCCPDSAAAAPRPGSDVHHQCGGGHPRPHDCWSADRHRCAIACSHSHSHAHSHSPGDGCSQALDSGAARPLAAVNSNLRGVYLHILADLLGSIGVIISSVLIKIGGEHSRLMIADPICSLAIAILILVSSGPLITDTAHVLLQRMPDGLAGAVDWCLAEVRRLPGVVGCRDPHVWEVKAGAGEVVGTVHVQVTAAADHQYVLRETKRIFAGLFKHLAVQVETVGLDDLVAHDLLFSPLPPAPAPAHSTPALQYPS